MRAHADELHEQLIALRNAHEQALAINTSETLQVLRRLRATRMRKTYADLCQSPRYQQATGFLINDLFGTDKLGIRASQLQRAESAMIKVMPEALLGMTVKAVHLTALTVELDVELADQLNRFKVEAGELSENHVAQALLNGGNLPRYRQQISLVGSVGTEIDTAVHKPFVAMALRMCRKPAHLMGLADLQDFLERGFAAFKNMQGAKEFLTIYAERENAILDNVFAGREHPFEPES